MSTFKSFEEINAWQRARDLTRRIYQISSEGHFASDYGLRDQMEISRMLSGLMKYLRKAGMKGIKYKS